MSNNRRPSLDALTGLRFVAAATVFVHHLGGKFGFENNRYSIGSVAVTFFFVLSGFVLTYAYHERIGNRIQVKRFLFNRFARIWPLHFVCLLIATVLIYCDSRLETAPFWQKFAANAFLLQSWIPASDWVFSFNAVAWSISTEAFFYALFPILMFAGGKRSFTRIAIAIIVAASFVLFVHSFSKTNWHELDYLRVGHVNPIVRLPEFCFGILAGRYFLWTRVESHVSEKRSLMSRFGWTLMEAVSVLAVITLCYWVTNQRFRLHFETSSWGSVFLSSWFRVAYPALPMAIVVLIFGYGKGLIGGLLSTKLMSYLGNISYSFYMIHFLVLRTISLASISYGPLTGWYVAGLAFLFSVGLSVLLFEFVELPAKQWLLHLYDGSRPESDQSRSPIGNRRLMAAALLTIAPPICLAFAIPQDSRTQEIENVIAGSIPTCRQVTFSGKAMLLGCSVEAQPEKQRIEMKLAWVKQVPFEHRRLVFVLNSEGKQIARGMHSQLPFENAETGAEFIDKVFLPNERLENGSQVIVCFRLKGKPPIKASSGNRRDYDQSLILLDRDRLKQLKAELAIKDDKPE